MSQFKPPQVFETISEIADWLNENSWRNFTQVREEMSKFLDFDYPIATFTRRFRNNTGPYELREMLAFVYAFTEGFGSPTCTAQIAFLLFDKAHLPPSDFTKLEVFFPAHELREARNIFQSHERNTISDVPLEILLVQAPCPNKNLFADEALKDVMARADRQRD